MPAHLCEACGGLPKENPGFLGTRVPNLSALVAPQRVGAHELLSTGWTKSTFDARVPQHGARGGLSPPELTRRVLNTRDQHTPSTKRSALSAHCPQNTRYHQRSSSTKHEVPSALIFHKTEPQRSSSTKSKAPPSAIQNLKIRELSM